jgi:hypothetical protein
MLFQETKDYVDTVVLPEYADGYINANNVAVQIMDDIDFFGDGNDLTEPTRLARNIAANREEFTDYVIKAFQDVEADNGFD